jgi:hypothetical protein
MHAMSGQLVNMRVCHLGDHGVLVHHSYPYILYLFDSQHRVGIDCTHDQRSLCFHVFLTRLCTSTRNPQYKVETRLTIERRSSARTGLSSTVEEEKSHVKMTGFSLSQPGNAHMPRFRKMHYASRDLYDPKNKGYQNTKTQHVPIRAYAPQAVAIIYKIQT